MGGGKRGEKGEERDWKGAQEMGRGVGWGGYLLK